MWRWLLEKKEKRGHWQTDYKIPDLIFITLYIELLYANLKLFMLRDLSNILLICNKYDIYVLLKNVRIAIMKDVQTNHK